MLPSSRFHTVPSNVCGSDPSQDEKEKKRKMMLINMSAMIKCISVQVSALILVTL